MSGLILAGSADNSAKIRIIDATTGAPETAVNASTPGLSLRYSRVAEPGGTFESDASIGTLSTLASKTAAHSPGGLIHLHDGFYRVDLPDAACASGATSVSCSGTATDMVIIPWSAGLVDFNPQDAVRLGLTSLPNAVAGALNGLPLGDANGDVTVGSLVANVITAASIATSALNGKGDWNTSTPLDAAGIRTAIGLAVANMDTQLGNIPTNTELNARTLPSADYVNTNGGAIQTLDALDTAQDTQHTATQDAIASLASSPGSGSIPYVPSTITVTAGTGASGTAADMANDDADVYSVQDSAGTLTLDLDYQFAAGVVAIQAIIVVDMQGIGDDVDLQFFDQVGLVYDTIDTISGDNGISYITLDKTIVQKYTTNAGLFQMRFTGTGLGGATLTINKAVVNAVANSTGIANGTTVTLSETTSNQNFIGKNWSLALGGQIIDGSYFEGAKDVTGISSNTNGAQYRFHDCQINSATFDADGVFTECGFVGATFGSTGGVTADDITIDGGGSRVPGASSPPMDFSAVSKTTSANIRGWMGGGNWTFAALITASIEVIKGGGHTVTTNGADVEFRGNPRSLSIVLSGGETVQILAEAGPISISGNGTGSTVNIYGYNSGVTNTATGSPTVSNFSLETDNVGGAGITQQEVRDAMKLAASAGAPATDSIDDKVDSIPLLNEIFQTQLTEGYSSDGVAPTLEQAIFFIMQILSEMSIAGTTMTVRRLDGATTAFTLTLNSATDPTSVSRTT